MVNKIRVLSAIVYVLGLAACGSDPQNDQGAASETGSNPVNGSEQTGPSIGSEQNNPIESRQAKLIDSTDDLPDCDDELESALVYVLASASFHVCRSGEWTVVDLKGEKGDAGEQGPKGDKGDTGAVGATGETGAKGDQGEQGIAGANGQDGAVGPQGETGPAGPQGPAGQDGLDVAAAAVGRTWTNPDTGERWLIAAEASTRTEALDLCTGDWSLPSGMLPFKMYNYFVIYFSTLPSTAAYWTDDETVARTIDSNGMSTVAAGESHFAICKAGPL